MPKRPTSRRLLWIAATLGLSTCPAPLALAQPVLDPTSPEVRQLPSDASRFTPLHVAAMKGDILTIQDLLDQGVPVDIRVENGFFRGATPLMMAARDADAATMAFLLDRGADVNARDDRRVSVLMWASSTGGSVEKIALALERGADVNPRAVEGDTALQWAAGLGRDPRMVELLVKAGAGVDVPDDRGRTPLMTAARVGNAGAVKILLDAGADRSRKSPQGLNALHWAAEGRTSNAETINTLLDAGMAVDTRTSDGSTPLLIAAMNDRPEQVAALLARGADVNATNGWGLTPLMAAGSSSPEVVGALLAAGADLDARDQAGRVALHYMVAKHNALAVRMLCNRGAELDVLDGEGIAPMHLARKMGTLDPLIRAGADLNIQCQAKQYAGWTPLMFAAASNDIVGVRRLLNAGADPMLGGENDVTPVRIAMAIQTQSGADSSPIADLIRDAIAGTLGQAPARRPASPASDGVGPQPQ
jgi:ankyrin repeat protein